MSINDKKGINLTSGFKYVGGQPLDVRLVAEDESDLQSLVDNGATYNGMVVWVNSTSKRMVFNGSEFIEDVSPDTIGNINDVLEQINGGGTFSGGGSSSGGSSGLNYVEYDIIIGDKYRERELDLNNINSCGSVYYNINANGLFDYVVPIKFATLTIGENNALIASSCSPFTDAAGFAKNIMFTLATSNTDGDVVAAYITFIKDSVRTAMWVQLNKGPVDIANQYVQLMGTLGIKIRLYY